MAVIGSRRVARLAALGAVSLTAAFGVAACGSSDDSSTTGAASTAEKPTGAPLKILVTTGVDTPRGSFPGDFSAAHAAANAINDEGGVNGGPVEIVECNNQNTPNGTTKCAREAVSEDAVAVVGTSIFGANSYPILGKAGIPSSLIALTAADLQAPSNFPVNGGAFVQTTAMGAAAAAAGAKTAVILCIELPGSDVTCGNVEAVAENEGVDVVGTVPISPTATTFGAVVQQLSATKADAVLIAAAGPQVPAVIQAAAAQGFSPVWVNALGAFSPETFGVVAGLSDKTWWTSSFPPYTAGDNYPGIANYNSQMDAAGEAGVENTDDPNRTESSVNVWAAIHGLSQVASQVDGDVTADTLMAALKQAEDINIEDLLTWSPGAPGFEGYSGVKDDGRAYLGAVKDGVYTPDPKDPKPVWQGVTLAG